MGFNLNLQKYFDMIGHLSTNWAFELVTLWSFLGLGGIFQALNWSSEEKIVETTSPHLLELVLTIIAKCLASSLLILKFNQLAELRAPSCNNQVSSPVRILPWGMLMTLMLTGLVSYILCPLLQLNNISLLLPTTFFILLVDLNKFALIIQVSMTEAGSNPPIIQGIRRVGPDLLLDTLAKSLAVGLGAVCGDTRIEQIARTICAQLVLFAIALLTFFPAVIQVNAEIDKLSPALISSSSAPLLRGESDLQKSAKHSAAFDEGNEAQKNVKLVMTGGLLLLHLRNVFLAGVVSNERIAYNRVGVPANREDTLGFACWSLQWIDDYIIWCFIVGLLCRYLVTSYGSWGQAKTPTVDASPQCDHQQAPDAPAAPVISAAPAKTSSASVVADKLVKKQSPIVTTRHSSLRPASQLKPLLEDGGSASEAHQGEKQGDSELSISAAGPESLSVRSQHLPPARKTSLLTGLSQRMDTWTQTDCGGITRRKVSHVPTVLDLAACHQKLNQGLGHTLSDNEFLLLLKNGLLKTHQLESSTHNHMRAVELRRLDLAHRLANPRALDRIPFQDFDYRPVFGQCAEEVIGYMQIPLGCAGPLMVDGKGHIVPLATTEGCLIASINRGCRAAERAGGITSVVYGDKMTRAPAVSFPTLEEMAECKQWIDSPEGFKTLKEVFEGTSGHACLQSILAIPSGRYLFIRFSSGTGEAMGMNMVSKGTDKALRELKQVFPNMEVIALSGNVCTDKKSAGINWILGRGKSVSVECRLAPDVLASVLHTTPGKMARLGFVKNSLGSAMAGAANGGYNAHAANVVAAIFAATGQDLAQVVDSSACMTTMEVDPTDSVLIMSCTMPCIEVGTIGGGTRLPAQRAALDLLDLNLERPAEHLARIIAATVLCGELSLMAALTNSSELVDAHMRHNRAGNTPLAAAGGEPRGPLPASSPTPALVQGAKRDRKHSIM